MGVTPMSPDDKALCFVVGGLLWLIGVLLLWWFVVDIYEEHHKHKEKMTEIQTDHELATQKVELEAEKMYLKGLNGESPPPRTIDVDSLLGPKIGNRELR